MRFILSFMVFTVFGFAQQSCQKGTRTATKTETAKTNSPAAAANAANNTAQPAPADDAARISLEEAKKAFDAGDAVFVDTRAASAYQGEHIKGAINIPAGEFETRYKEVPKDKKIIAYCS